MASPPSGKSPSTELDFRRSLLRINATVTLITTAIKYGTLVACVYLGYLSIESLAGRVTLATVGIRLLGNLRVSEGICAILTTGGIVYGVGQRRLRHKAVKHLGNAKNELEKILDPGRSSSGLTEAGGTRPEDEI